MERTSLLQNVFFTCLVYWTPYSADLYRAVENTCSLSHVLSVMSSQSVKQSIEQSSSIRHVPDAKWPFQFSRRVSECIAENGLDDRDLWLFCVRFAYHTSLVLFYSFLLALEQLEMA